MKQISRLNVILGALALAACASQPSATPVGAGGSRHTSPTVSNDSKDTPKGCTQRLIGGQELFCRNDVDTGSRVSHTEVCLTREQLEVQQRNSRNVTQQIQGTGLR